ncbi:hypothetical protein THOM_1200 [Trachipleistophora hominis]|uniref:Uncharacterized protein n=1 Tax=Trachipleistophora hominis TaxID=72359 RepID=L7JWJ4_TRAHO|nr:hypothetical protein THOM_1200 [Trachipleistophora hominis]
MRVATMNAYSGVKYIKANGSVLGAFNNASFCEYFLVIIGEMNRVEE